MDDYELADWLIAIGIVLAATGIVGLLTWYVLEALS